MFVRTEACYIVTFYAIFFLVNRLLTGAYTTLSGPSLNYYQKQKARFIQGLTLLKFAHHCWHCSRIILSRKRKSKNKITPKKILSIIIYYDSKSKLFISLFFSLSLSLFTHNSTLFLSREDKAINYKLRSISIHADVRRYQDHQRWKHHSKQKRIFVTVFHPPGK